MPVEHKSLAEALAAFQGAAPKLHKGNEAKAGSFSYKYVDLADIVVGLQSLMAEHGLSFSAFPSHLDGKPALRYVLRHSSGESEGDTMPLMLAKPDAQAQGSAITYARRYAMCAALNLVADADDDGAAAGQNGMKHAAAHTPDGYPDLRRAAKGLNVAQIRQAFRDVALQPPGGEVPAWQFFDGVPVAKAGLLCEALEAIGRAT